MLFKKYKCILFYIIHISSSIQIFLFPFRIKQVGSCIPIYQSTLLKPYIRVLHYFFRFSHIYSIKLVKNIARKNIISNASVISNGLPDIKPYKTYIKLLPRIMTSVFINASITKRFIKSSLFYIVNCYAYIVKLILRNTA